MSDQRIKASLSPEQIDAAPRCGVEATAYAKAYSAVDAARYVALGGCDISAVAMARAGAHAITRLDSVYVEIAVFPAGCIPTIWDDGATLWDVETEITAVAQTGDAISAIFYAPTMARVGDDEFAVYDLATGAMRTYLWGGSSFSESTPIYYGPGATLGRIYRTGKNHIAAALTWDVATLRRYQRDNGVWAQIGLPYTCQSCVSYKAMTGFYEYPYLSDNVAAVYEKLGDWLSMYSWNGTYYEPVGAPLEILVGDSFCLTFADSESVVLAAQYSGGSELRAYRFDYGTNAWSQVGATLDLPGVIIDSIERVSDSDFALWDSAASALFIATFDGASFSVGVPLYTLSAVSVSMSKYSDTMIAWIDSIYDTLRMLEMTRSDIPDTETLWDGCD